MKRLLLILIFINSNIYAQDLLKHPLSCVNSGGESSLEVGAGFYANIKNKTNCIFDSSKKVVKCLATGGNCNMEAPPELGGGNLVNDLLGKVVKPIDTIITKLKSGTISLKKGFCKR